MIAKRIAWVLASAVLGSSCLVSVNTECVGEECVTHGSETECDIDSELPDALLATCFGKLESGEFAPNLRPFEPQFDVFNGGVTKRRWAYLPPGSSIDSSDPDAWRYPTGSIFWQEISAGSRVETQMLEKTGEGIGRSAWRASVYLWTADGRDAHRVRQGGETYRIDELDDWSEPDEAICMDCHQAPDDVVLGFSALQLSNLELEGNIDTWPNYLSTGADTRAVDMVGDQTDQRMLGYLHANCGGCHSDRGTVAGLGLDLSYSAATPDLLSAAALETSLYRELRMVPTGPGISTVYTLLQSGEMPPARRTAAVDTAKAAELLDWIRGLEWPTSIQRDAPVAMSAEAEEGALLLGYDVTVADAIEGGTVFSRKEPHSFRSRVTVPVDPSLTYRVSGRFRSSGAVPSRFYFGVAPYEADGEFIAPFRANRQGTQTTINRASTTATTITTSSAIDDWNQVPAPGFRRAVGIYFDGDTSKLPDYVHYNFENTGDPGESAGAYSVAAGTTITLNLELPDEVLAAMTDDTVVANHFSGSTFLYTAASAVMAGPDWTEFSGELTGTAFSGNVSQFRPGTAFVKLLILANYQQPDEATELLWDDLRFEVVP